MPNQTKPETHNFDTDPILTEVDGEWLHSKGYKTTLGADNGIGVAMALAALLDKSYEHGPIETLFTVDEETGLTGAKNLGKDMITGNILINLDSEDEAQIFLGCAGGIDTLGHFDYTDAPAPAGYQSSNSRFLNSRADTRVPTSTWDVRTPTSSLPASSSAYIAHMTVRWLSPTSTAASYATYPCNAYAVIGVPADKKKTSASA